MSVCDNCGREIVSDLEHRADPYEKGLCETFARDNDGALVKRGWSASRPEGF